MKRVTKPSAKDGSSAFRRQGSRRGKRLENLSVPAPAVLQLLAALCPEIMQDSQRVSSIQEGLQDAATASTEGQIVQPVTKLTVDAVVSTFSLTYSDKSSDYALHNNWNPQNDTIATSDTTAITPEEENLIHQALPHLNRWLFLYDEIAVRRSEAICRMPADQVLLEAIAILSGHSANYALRENQLSASRHVRRMTPTIYSHLQLFAELDLNFSPPAPVDPDNSIIPPVVNPVKTTYTGRLDYAVGIQSRVPIPLLSILPKPKHTSLLVVVEAKKHNGIFEARDQLLAYLGCLHNARRLSGTRPDFTTYGIGTDGYKWVFLKITHNGVVQFSPETDVRAVGWAPILRTILMILKVSVFLQIPRSSPLKNDQKADVTTVVADDSEWLSEGKEFFRTETDSEGEDEM